MTPEEVCQAFDAVVSNVASVLYGKDSVVRMALFCLVAEGHLLLEDLPGVGKTTLAKALARSLGLSFRRVQFTADLLPSDLLGAMVFDRADSALSFRPGPVFTNLLLADELNRASPRAQSALLETMEERQASIDGVTRPLPRPFMVIATQNPFDAAGTYPLPHSQRDRFLLRVAIGYPDRRAEEALLAGIEERISVDDLPVVCSPSTLAALGAAARAVHVSEAVRGYILDLVGATRTHPALQVGASPRAALAVQRAARVSAVSAGRPFVTPDDVKSVAVAVMEHRLVSTPAAELSGTSIEGVVRELLAALPVPVSQRV